jgi:predicted MFS family arabinose efflux permease
MGTAQGWDTIATNVGNIFFSNAINSPDVGPIIGDYIGGFIEQQVRTNYGTYWAVGVILAVLGFLLVAWGDRKARSPLEKVPLVSPPLSVTQEG